jgi:acetylglutamate kinase
MAFVSHSTGPHTGKTVVIKYGGAAMTDPALKVCVAAASAPLSSLTAQQEGVIRDLVLLSTVGIRPILVHGGGPEINGWLKRLNIEPNFRNGLRVTDAATMEVVEMVLVGKVNKSLVSLINQAGGSAVGMCGKDGNLLSARVLDPELGLVGEVTDVDTRVITGLVAAGHIPVVATVAADADGGALNVNADTAAGELAASLGAEKLVLMTDVRGLLRDKNDADTLIREVTISGVRRLVADGIVAGGMIPKVECCVRALAQGVRATHIIDGRTPHSLLLEILTDAGGGTMIAG